MPFYFKNCLWNVTSASVYNPFGVLVEITLNRKVHLGWGDVFKASMLLSTIVCLPPLFACLFMFLTAHPFFHEGTYFAEFILGLSQWWSTLSRGLCFWNAFHWFLPMWGYNFICWWYNQSTCWVVLLVPVAGQWVLVGFLRTQLDLVCGWCGSIHGGGGRFPKSISVFLTTTGLLMCFIAWPDVDDVGWTPKVCFLYVLTLLAGAFSIVTEYV